MELKYKKGVEKVFPSQQNDKGMSRYVKSDNLGFHLHVNLRLKSEQQLHDSAESGTHSACRSSNKSYK